MSESKQKGPDDITGQFRSADELPDTSLARLRPEVKPENIVIVQKVVEKTVYRDRPAEVHVSHTHQHDIRHQHEVRWQPRRTPYSYLTPTQKRIYWAVIGGIALAFTLFLLAHTHP